METGAPSGPSNENNAPELPEEPLRDPRILGALIMAWGAAYPIILMIGVQFGEWMIAPHYYDLPAVFFAHFLFFMGGFIMTRGKIGVGKWLTIVAAVIGIASAVLVLSLIHMVKPHDIGENIGLGLRIFLYVLHALYLAGNVYFVWAVFKVKQTAVTA